MAGYASKHQRTASTTQSLGSVTADATRPRRIRHFFMVLGSQGTPADAAFLWVIQRCTAAGTSTAVTPEPLDPGDLATEQDAGEAHSVEPTYTSGKIVLDMPWNQKAGQFRWVALDERKVIVTPATAGNGIGVQTPTSAAVAITGTLHWED